MQSVLKRANIANSARKEFYEIDVAFFKNLYLKDDMSDVKFVFVDEVRKEKTCERKIIAKIPAHKFLLVAASEVFRVMFNELWKEKNEVEIEDASPDAFKEFLQCIYLPKGKFTNANIEQVMNLANKYQITECMNVCVRFLIENLTPDIACLGYGLATLHDQHDLKQFCEEKIIRNAPAVFSSDHFLKCDREVLADILKLELNCTAAIVFDGCLAWAKNTCKMNGIDGNNTKNLRTQLGECLYFIRFNEMKLQTFIERTAELSGLFEADDFQDIIYSISLNGFKSKKFNRNPPRLRPRPTS